MTGPQLTKINSEKKDRILKLWREGLMKSEISRRLDIHVATVARIIREFKP